jgi:hypothetical protein
MFRIIFILFILFISLYGLYGVFSPLQRAADAEQFDIYLSEALERNTINYKDTTTARVVFYRKDFVNSPGNFNNLSTGNKQ